MRKQLSILDDGRIWSYRWYRIPVFVTRPIDSSNASRCLIQLIPSFQCHHLLFHLDTAYNNSLLFVPFFYFRYNQTHGQWSSSPPAINRRQNGTGKTFSHSLLVYSTGRLVSATKLYSKELITGRSLGIYLYSCGKLLNQGLSRSTWAISSFGRIERSYMTSVYHPWYCSISWLIACIKRDKEWKRFREIGSRSSFLTCDCCKIKLQFVGVIVFSVRI